MSDLIDRQAVIDALAKQMPTPYTPDGSHPADEGIFQVQEVYVDCIETLELLPPAQPERKTGKWIEINNGLDTTCECSACHYKDYIPNDKDYKCYDRYWFHRNYCPNCGAEMKGETT